MDKESRLTCQQGSAALSHFRARRLTASTNSVAARVDDGAAARGLETGAHSPHSLTRAQDPSVQHLVLDVLSDEENLTKSLAVLPLVARQR